MQVKKNLESAQTAFDAFKSSQMAKRREMLAQNQREFSQNEGNKFKEHIVNDAKKALQLVEIKRLNEEADRKRKEKAMEKKRLEIEQQKAEGTYEEPQPEEDSWGRGS